MAFHDDDDKEAEGGITEGSIDDALDEPGEEDDIDDLNNPLIDDERAWE